MWSRRRILLCTGLIGLAVVVARRSATSERAPASGRAVTTTGDPVAALRREVDVLEQQVRASRTISVARATPSSNDTVEARDAAPPPAKAIEPGEAATMLEAHLASESADPAWGDPLRRELSKALELSQGETSVSAVECATSLCKVTLTHGSLEAQRQLAPAIAGLPVLGAGVLYSYLDSESPPRTVLYVVRDGHDINEMLTAR